MDPATISTSIESNRYNPELIKDLEAYVQHQVTNGTYHFEANLALLKSYQFNPARCNTDIISLILQKALMALPSTDFLLCSYLISEKSQSNETITLLSTLSSHLECARFKDFWAEASKLQKTPPGFDNAIRNFILGVLLTTYQGISKAYFAQVLNLDTSAVDKLATEKGWSISATTITLPPHEEESTKKKVSETYTLDQMSRVLQTLH
eukprot:TRINITY_DN2714_c0_g1_i1.p1 TRINITY_DN2714_c0_g1~~TRINITY_DN2714_c0_g1_i1.p1  ORF type:complete len:208 (+),score=46.07 TRINITY_DN2714_c0_g1_i1:106-729(+)